MFHQPYYCYYAAMVKEKRKGQYLALALPWDDPAVIEAAVEGYKDLEPNHERCMRLARGAQIKMSLVYKHRGRRMSEGWGVVRSHHL